ncbi:helix-turn-helix domain-containing protein [Roseateles aquae]|uniref:helix-turn-helix domain-containing protein n=1 Tax=Roseateles aquae TaxID=3077235 RepID=UPI003312F894
MLNRLPSDPGSFRELLSDLGLSAHDTPRIARALGVSERTVWRWFASEAPRVARLSLWWLSRHGHSVWDAEMHNRTQLALTQQAALWREVAKLRQAQLRTPDLRAYGPPANEPSAYGRVGS